MNPLREWWLTLSLGERRAARLGAGLLALALAYVLVWTPVMQERERLREQAAQARADLAWMRGAALEIGRMTARRIRGERSLRDTLSGLGADPKIERLPRNEGTQARFERIEADALLRWFDRVRRDTAWMVRDARIERLESG